MRPKLITPTKVLLAITAIVIFAALVYWLNSGSKIAFVGGVPSTAGKIAFVREENSTSDIYMADGTTGANMVALTNDGKGADSEPAWSPDGETLALTSDRNGATRQMYLMEATPGAKVGERTNTSATKELPQYGPNQDVYYLDGGRISKISPVSGDMDAVFPTAEQKRSALKDLFGFGGVTRFAVSKDGSRVYAAVKQENGEALVVWAPEEGAVGAMGVAEKVLFHFAEDDALIAVFVHGEPYPKPFALLTGELGKQEDYSAPALPPLASTDVNALIKIDLTLAITPIEPIPFAPTGITIAPDGKTGVITSTDKKLPGVFTFDLTNIGSGGGISELPASEPAFSPDGSMLAFVSGNDVYTMPVSGGEPKNLTQGKGRNLAPTWSPVQVKK